MRDYVLVYINGVRHEIRGEDAFMTLSNYLRERKSMVGTKVVCEEGDCGACTVLKSSLPLKNSQFLAINSCITFMHLLDCSHIITVEALEENHVLHPIQQSMVDHHGSQCGFCTPGIVMSLADLFENNPSIKPTEKKVQNYLTGNLCRCTGYRDIIKAGMNVETSKLKSLRTRYHKKEVANQFATHCLTPYLVEYKNKKAYGPMTVKDAIKFMKTKKAEMISSATDMGVLFNKRKHMPNVFVNLNHVQDLYEIKETGDHYEVGAKVTLENLRIFMRERVPEFGNFLNIFASPQIKNSATLVGNIVNASPIADTVPYLAVVGAKLLIQGDAEEPREVAISGFYSAYKEIALGASEVVTKVIIPKLKKNQKIKLYKVSRRKDLDISTVNAAFLLNLDGSHIKDAKIAYGGVGPTIRITDAVADALKGKELTEKTFMDASKKLDAEISPMDDVRGTKEFRMKLSKNLLLKCFHDLKEVH